MKRGALVFGFCLFLHLGYGEQRKVEHEEQGGREERWRLFHYEAATNRKEMLPPQIKTTRYFSSIYLYLFFLFLCF